MVEGGCCGGDFGLWDCFPALTTSGLTMGKESVSSGT